MKHLSGQDLAKIECLTPSGDGLRALVIDLIIDEISRFKSSAIMDSEIISFAPTLTAEIFGQIHRWTDNVSAMKRLPYYQN